VIPGLKDNYPAYLVYRVQVKIFFRSNSIFYPLLALWPVKVNRPYPLKKYDEQKKNIIHHNKVDREY